LLLGLVDHFDLKDERRWIAAALLGYVSMMLADAERVAQSADVLERAFSRLGQAGASVEDETALVNAFRIVALARLAAAQSRASDRPAALETLGRLAGLRSAAFARQLQVDHVELAGVVEPITVAFLVHDGEIDLARELIEKRILAPDVRPPSAVWQSFAARAFAFLVLGDIANAQRELREVSGMPDAIVDPEKRSEMLSKIAGMQLRLGDTVGAAETARRALVAARQIPLFPR